MKNSENFTVERIDFEERNANLQTADLSTANLQTADLSTTNLDGLDLTRPENRLKIAEMLFGIVEKIKSRKPL